MPRSVNPMSFTISIGGLALLPAVGIPMCPSFVLPILVLNRVTFFSAAIPPRACAVSDTVLVVLLCKFLTIVIKGSMNTIILAILILHFVTFLSIDMPADPCARVVVGWCYMNTQLTLDEFWAFNDFVR